VDNETLRIALLVGIGATFGLWLVASLFVRVSGTWVEVLDDRSRSEGKRPNKMTLSALGPMVSGESLVLGGREELSGVIVGRTLYLKRRDHGIAHLKQQGYPDAIAALRDGKVAARMKLKLVSRDTLDGEFLPFKVKFTHQPPRVTGVVPLRGHARTYTRIALVDDKVPAEAATYEETLEPV